MKKRFLHLSAGILIFSQAVHADPIIVLRPNTGSVSAGVLPQTAFSPEQEQPGEEQSLPMDFDTPFKPTIKLGDNYSYKFETRRAKGRVTFRSDRALPAGLTLDADTGILSGSPIASGVYTVSIIAQDTSGQVTARVFLLTVEEDRTPINLNLPDKIRFIQNSQQSYTIQASNAEAPLDFRVYGGELPDGLTLDTATGIISGIARTPGSYVVELSVTDRTGRITVTITTLIVEAQRPPIDLNLPSEITFTKGKTQSYTIEANNAEAPLNFRIYRGNLPSGLILNSATGTISGKANTAGSYVVDVSVSDKTGRITAKVTTILVE